jgi:hypothetical protein
MDEKFLPTMKNILFVNLQQDGDGFVFDGTHEQIMDGVTTGKDVVMKLYDGDTVMSFRLQSVSGEQAVFAGVRAVAESGALEVAVITVFTDNRVDCKTISVAGTVA